jgi:biotin operon repressor BirA-like protein
MSAPPFSPSPEFVILCELLEHESGFVSGTALAKRLGVSRVAVWQHMEKLRAQGFGFEAVRSRGYRLILISNTNRLHYEYIRRTYPILRAFDHVVLSYKLKTRKPEPAIYRAALRLSGVPPSARVERTIATRRAVSSAVGARRTARKTPSKMALGWKSSLIG